MVTNKPVYVILVAVNLNNWHTNYDAESSVVWLFSCGYIKYELGQNIFLNHNFVLPVSESNLKWLFLRTTWMSFTLIRTSTK